jgi:hypothetical protein
MVFLLEAVFSFEACSLILASGASDSPSAPDLDCVFHLAGAGLGGDEAGSEDHCDESQSDEHIVHLSVSLLVGFYFLPS